jgi:hypothetical protein
MRVERRMRCDAFGDWWWLALLEQRVPDGRLAAQIVKFPAGSDRQILAFGLANGRRELRDFIRREGAA